MDKIISSTELQKELAKLPKQNAYSTGYQKLDNYLGSVREGDLIILTGMTGEGKSQFGVSLTKSFIEQKLNCLWFSYEISSQELFERFGLELPVFYLPRLMASKQMDWIERKIVEGVRNYGTKVVFIDHLHYLIDSSTAGNRNVSEILGSMCRSLKMIARKERIIIIALAHTRKIRGDAHRPTIDDLKDSSGIAQESDTVLIIQRKGKRRGKKNDDDIPELSTDCRIWIDKSRRTGRLGVCEMFYDTEKQIHVEYTDLEEES